MSDHNDGGAAFPLGTSSNSEAEHMMAVGTGGMSLRDWFAGQAVSGMASSPDMWAAIAKTAKSLGISESSCIAASAYDIADSMLSAREVKR